MPTRHETLGSVTDSAAAQWGDAIGWVFEDQRVSFNHMRDRSRDVARSLLAQGVGRGDVVAVWMPNLAEFAYCLIGCARIGAILVAINTRSKLFEAEHVLTHSRAKLLIMVDRFLKHDYGAILTELCGAGAVNSEGRVSAANLPYLQRVIGLSGAPAAAVMPWTDFLAAGAMVAPEQLEAVERGIDPKDAMLLQYTSGTTALPKGALCNHVYVVNYGAEIARRIGMQFGEGFMNTQPFYHVGGACGALPLPFTFGCRVVVPEYYEAERVLALIERERCVARTGFSAMYIMEMDHPRFADFDLTSLRSGWCVGTPEIMERVRDRMGISGLIQLYGSTEGSGVSGSPDEPWEKRSRSCGRAFPDMELAIFDMATGKRAAAGASGEIVLRGWCTMNGYLHQPEETAKAIDGEGWVHTGDRGYLDAEGYLYFQGRIKNMLKVGGENVSAEEVEAMLLRHPAIKLAAVVGAPDPRLHEVVMAIVELNTGAQVTEAEIIAFCAARMANFRVPKYVRFTADWPMTGSGKIQTHVLRERYSRDPALFSGAAR